MTSSILAAKGRLFHFHVADSNRRHVGAGHTDFRAILDSLDRIGYAGFLSAEILPHPDPDSAAQNNIHALRRILTDARLRRA